MPRKELVKNSKVANRTRSKGEAESLSLSYYNIREQSNKWKKLQATQQAADVPVIKNEDAIAQRTRHKRKRAEAEVQAPATNTEILNLGKVNENEAVRSFSPVSSQSDETASNVSADEAKWYEVPDILEYAYLLSVSTEEKEEFELEVAMPMEQKTYSGTFFATEQVIELPEAKRAKNSDEIPNVEAQDACNLSFLTYVPAVDEEDSDVKSVSTDLISPGSPSDLSLRDDNSEDIFDGQLSQMQVEDDFFHDQAGSEIIGSRTPTLGC